MLVLSVCSIPADCSLRRRRAHANQSDPEPYSRPRAPILHIYLHCLFYRNFLSCWLRHMTMSSPN